KGWRWRAAINGLGAATTAVVAVEVAISKFALGAWIILLIVPALIVVLWSIRQHYLRVAQAITPETPVERARVRPRVMVPVARLNVATKQALAFAGAIAPDGAVTAVHVADSADEATDFRAEWDAW